MSQRRSAKLSRITEEPALMPHSKSTSKTKRASKTASLKSISATKSLKSKSIRKRASTTSKRVPSTAKKPAKAAPKTGSSSSEKILTPLTPEITTAMLEKKPWLSNEFLLFVLEALKSPSTISREKPKMLSLVGPMAAGKSTVKRQLNFNDAVNLDVDEVKIIAIRQFGKKAAGIFADYAKIIQMLSVIIIDNKYDFILDTTGKMKEPIKYAMKKAKAANYIIDVAIVYSTKELCETRAQHRNVTYAARTAVPIFAVSKVYDDFKDTRRAKSYIMGIKDIVDMTDNLYLFDNSRCTPEAALIMEKHGQKINVHEDFPDFYGVSVSQLSPHLVAHGLKKTRKHGTIHRSRSRSRSH